MSDRALTAPTLVKKLAKDAGRGGVCQLSYSWAQPPQEDKPVQKKETKMLSRVLTIFSAAEKYLQCSITPSIEGNLCALRNKLIIWNGNERHRSSARRCDCTAACQIRKDPNTPCLIPGSALLATAVWSLYSASSSLSGTACCACPNGKVKRTQRH